MFNILYASCCLALFIKTSLSMYEKHGIYLHEGAIKGLRANDGDYNMYLGIPYAKVNQWNHFGPAIPVKIKNPIEAYDDTKICPQFNPDTGTIMGTIDCLRLNVFVPRRENMTDKILPVMIWIYGGQFEFGYAGRNNFGPSYFMQHDIILVTFNYRTGPYGFMCLDLPEVSGNQGLKDQYLAISWVKENIEAFGGDPEQITVFGQSAGGHSIDLHLMSPKKVLFNKAILQSGSAEALTVLYDPDKSAPLKIARYIGFDTNSIEESIDYLSKANINLVINAALKLQIRFKPCVEAPFYNVVPFISTPWVIDGTPNVKNLSIMMGFTKLEMAKLYNKKDDYFNSTEIINENLGRVFDFGQQVLESKPLIQNFYVGEQNSTETLKWGLIRFASDITYIHPIHRTLQKYLDHKAGKIYFYMFSYVGRRNEIVTKNYDEYDSHGNACCAAHKDDIAYLFNVASKPALTTSDTIIMRRMTKMWTNFAIHGNPTPVIDDTIPIIWKPSTSCKHHTFQYLNIDSNFTLGKRPLSQRMAFLDLFFLHCKQSMKGYEEEEK